MIAIETACEIIFQYYQEEIYITQVMDIEYGYVICICDTNGETFDVSPDIVDKKTGKMDCFFPPDHREELKNGKLVDIPEKYKMPLKRS